MIGLWGDHLTLEYFKYTSASLYFMILNEDNIEIFMKQISNIPRAFIYTYFQYPYRDFGERSRRKPQMCLAELHDWRALGRRSTKQPIHEAKHQRQL